MTPEESFKQHLEEEVEWSKSMEEAYDLRIEFAMAWVDYRDAYGIRSDQMTTAHKAFKQGWLVGKGLIDPDKGPLR